MFQGDAEMAANDPSDQPQAHRKRSHAGPGRAGRGNRTAVS